MEIFYYYELKKDSTLLNMNWKRKKIYANSLDSARKQLNGKIVHFELDGDLEITKNRLIKSNIKGYLRWRKNEKD